MIQSGNWRGERDTVWELEDGVNVIQPGNWRGALDTVWELEGST